MTAGSHVVIGLAAWSVAAPHLGLSTLAPLPLVLSAAGALLPDIDHPGSWVGRRLDFVARPLALAVSHRGVTHSLLAVLLCLVALRGWPRSVVVPLAIGYLSHLAADMLTPAGLRLAWPLRARQSLPLCRTGSLGEFLIVTALIGLLALRFVR